MNELVKGPFWSNCVIEAVKTKITHPFRVKLTIVPRSEANCPHFLWSDGENDYDFSTDRHIAGVKILYFRGYIRKHKLGFNQKYKEQMKRRKQQNPGQRWRIC